MRAGRTTLLVFPLALALVAGAAGEAQAKKRMVRKDPCARLTDADIPQHSGLLKAAQKFNAGDYKKAGKKFGKLQKKKLDGALGVYAQYGSLLVESRKGTGQEGIKKLLARAKKLKTKQRCILKTMIEVQPYSLNVGDIFQYKKRALRKLAEPKFLKRAESIELFGDFFAAMRARPPLLNIKVCFDNFNAIRGDLKGARLAAVKRISDKLDKYQATLFADAPSVGVIGSE